MEMPIGGVGATHQHVYTNLPCVVAAFVPEQAKSRDGGSYLRVDLLYEHTHREAPDQSARPSVIVLANPMP